MAVWGGGAKSTVGAEGQRRWWPCPSVSRVGERTLRCPTRIPPTEMAANVRDDRTEPDVTFIK